MTLNFVWDQIKKVDPTWADLYHELINTGSESQEYTVKSGDMLSKIAQHFYGDGNDYSIIAKANNLSNPNALKAGEKLNIPVKS